MTEIQTWQTRSRSRPGVVHELVSVAERVLSCACPAFTFRGKCRHADRLRDFLAEFQRTARAARRTPRHERPRTARPRRLG